MRFLIVGAGSAGSVHTDFLARQGHEVFIYDTDYDQAETLAVHSMAVPVLDDDGDYDCAVICTPTNTHRDLIETHLGRGRKVVCETPLALTSLDANVLASRCDPRSLFVAESIGVGLGPLKQRLLNGELGWPLLWRACGMATWRPPEWVSNLRLGGGAFLESGAHFTTVARMLFGEPISHFGSLMKFSTVDADASDTGTMIVDYVDGHQLVLQLAWGTEQCLDGQYEATLPDSYGLIGPRRCEPFCPEPQLDLMWRNLAACLTGTAEPLVTLEQAAGGISDVWSCYDSVICTNPDCSY